MKEYFPILTHYNTLTNKALYDILVELPAGKLKEDVGSYFKSIYGVINHVYASDAVWLQRIRKVLPNLDSINTAEIDITVSWPATEIFGDFSELRAHREALDSTLERFVEELGENDLEAVIDYTNSRGERKRFILWQAMIHIFNHQTHHRGQIAEILDQLGVTNDYSNVIATLTEPPLA